MFISEKEKYKIVQGLTDINVRLDALEPFKRLMVECETCGCLLDINTAIKGESKIVRELNLNYNCSPFERFMLDKEAIKNTYYCKVHAPKAKTIKFTKKLKKGKK